MIMPRDNGIKCDCEQMTGGGRPVAEGKSIFQGGTGSAKAQVVCEEQLVEPARGRWEVRSRGS